MGPSCRPRLATWMIAAAILSSALGSLGRAQPYGEPDRDSPGDAMIQAYLQLEASKLAAGFQEDLQSRVSWEAKRDRYMEQYYYMLGLWPLPEKTPLNAQITRTLEGDGYQVDMLHFQSRPGLYVTANLYRPRNDAGRANAERRLPAVLYVCGHSHRGRNGNKVAYQSHGIWFARHGYICLVVDSLQLGEIAATHHGTYNLGRWWWHSRGYTPAGVEAWNGVRAIDYLVSRPDVDPERIAVTGISGGGAATFWIAAADPRVRVAIPVSGMADLESYIANRVINGHCDCMFLYNTFQWPWTRIAALVAPRPMLFVNSDQDRIFPMDANQRVINRLESLYSLFGAGDLVDAVVSVGGHAYRKDIRQAAYRFINSHLKDDPRIVEDSERDIVSEGSNPGPYPIPPESLRVFPSDADLPRDERNTTIDESFVPMARPEAPAEGEFAPWHRELIAELRRVSFAYFPDEIPPAEPLGDRLGADGRFRSEERIEFRLRPASGSVADGGESVLLVVLNETDGGRAPEWVRDVAGEDQAVVLCEPRGIGPTRWTRRNPPNYVERSHALLGRTVDAGRVWDIIAAVRYLRRAHRNGADAPRKVHVAGSGAAGILGAYAAALCPEVSKVTLVAPPASHMEPNAPQLLNVLRVADIPEVLGALAPRPLRLVDCDPASFQATLRIYTAALADGQLTLP